LVDTNTISSIMFHFNELDDDYYDKFQKFIFTGDDRNIRKVFVNGKLVHDSYFN
jgi:hypothetical protein